MSTDPVRTDSHVPREASDFAAAVHPPRCAVTPPPDGEGSTYEAALALFHYTLDQQERPRPDIHGVMLHQANREVIARTSQALQTALQAGERVWLTADLHLGHRNVITYCDRPFADISAMDQALVRQLGKVGPDDWLIIAGDVAMGDHTLAFPALRQIPGRKVLVLGNHDITRAGRCHYVDAVGANGSPLFEAVVPFLYWAGHGGQQVIVSHYPLCLPPDSCEGQDQAPAQETPAQSLPLLNYHGHLHRDLLPHTARIQYVNVGWDVTQGLVCL